MPTVLGYGYYPGVTDIASARPLDIEAGAELQAIDLSLPRKPRTYRMRGSVIDGRTGQAPPRANVTITPKAAGFDAGGIGGPGDELGGRSYNPASGTFEIRDLLPGTYVVTASVPNPPNPNARGTPTVTKGTATVTLGDSDADGIAIRAVPGATIPGRLRFDTNQLRITQFLPLALVPVDSGDNGRLPFVGNDQTNTDGTFQINNVPPGEYRVSLNPIIAQYIKEARFEGVDVLNAPLRFSGAVSGTLDVVLASGGGRVSGAVLDAQAQPMPITRVVLVPDRRDRTEAYKVATTDQSGRFTIAAIAPGDYKVFSWESLPEFGWFDTEVLAQSETYGHAVHVTESSTETLEVKLIPAGVIR
jgi:hypothetical protein